MGWPALSLGNNFYALVTGIWSKIVLVCERVFAGRGAAREACRCTEKLTHFYAENAHPCGPTHHPLKY